MYFSGDTSRLNKSMLKEMIAERSGSHKPSTIDKTASQLNKCENNILNRNIGEITKKPIRIFHDMKINQKQSFRKRRSMDNDIEEVKKANTDFPKHHILTRRESMSTDFTKQHICKRHDDMNMNFPKHHIWARRDATDTDFSKLKHHIQTCQDDMNTDFPRHHIWTYRDAMNTDFPKHHIWTRRDTSKFRKLLQTKLPAMYESIIPYDRENGMFSQGNPNTYRDKCILDGNNERYGGGFRLPHLEKDRANLYDYKINRQGNYDEVHPHMTATMASISAQNNVRGLSIAPIALKQRKKTEYNIEMEALHSFIALNKEVIHEHEEQKKNERIQDTLWRQSYIYKQAQNKVQNWIDRWDVGHKAVMETEEEENQRKDDVRLNGQVVIKIATATDTDLDIINN